MELSHKQICAIAVAWLKRSRSRSGPGCTIAVSESGNWINGEIPDAIGWRPYRQERCGSVVVEVKTSRADFLADAKKMHRENPAEGMGTYRYFMAPTGIIQVAELPPRWGLVEVTARGHIKVRAGHVLLRHVDPDIWKHTCNKDAEISTLALCLNRVGDAQKLQDMLRDKNNGVSRLVKQNEELQQRVRALSLDLYNSKED